MRFNSSYPRRSGAVLALLGGLLLTGLADAQQQQGPPLPNPRLYILTPAGGKVGTSAEVVCAGADLEDAQALLFSHPGIKAELLAQAPAPPPDPKNPQPKRKRGQPAANSPPARFKVTIANDVPLGIHDVRLINKWGISNPRAFVVGDLAEVMEKEPNNDVDQAQKVDLNSTVTGTISAPTDVDYYTFSGKKGQRVIISCLASSIDSRLQATLELYDKAGKQLGYNRNYQDSDALLDYTLPGDGDYFVRLYQYTYTAGTAEYFYRLSITTAPWIDAVFPPVVEPGKPAKLTVYGRNLPGGQLDPKSVVDGRTLEKLSVTVNVPNDPAALQRLAYSGHLLPSGSGLDGFEYRIKNAAGTSNPFLLAYAQAPVVLDNEANDTAAQAQDIPLPCEIAGRIEKKRDQDWYSFTAKKDAVYNIEVVSERQGAPTSMEFVLINAATKQVLYESPDNLETLTPFKFYTRSADPARYVFKVPADGKYLLLVKSLIGDTLAGPRHLYRVRITPNQPDFRLVLVPESSHYPDACVVRQGGNHYFDVFVWRADGFNGEISLNVEGLPDGVTCPPQTIGPGLRHGALAFSAAPGAAPWVGEIKVKGTAVIDGKSVVREARAGSVTWPIPGNQQQNIVTISRLARNLVLGVREGAPFSLTATPDKSVAQPGDTINLALKVARLSPDFKGPLIVNAAMPLAGNQGSTLSFNNNNQPVNVAGTDGKATLRINANAIPGTYTIVLRGLGQMPFNKDPGAKQKPNIGTVQGSAPFTITVVPKDLATLSLAPANAEVKMGTQTEVVIKVARKFDYAGEFKVQLVLPPGAKGISADEVTIPAGKDEIKLVIKADADAQQGNRANLIVRAVAMFNGSTPITHDTKFSVNVTK